MARPTFESAAAGYRRMWASMRITRAAQCDAAARRIMAGRARYLAVERQVGVPWFVIGLWHGRESGYNFKGVLHNGEHIIGTGRKTRLVPAGRGPFNSWEEAAEDALKLKGLHRITDWHDIARIGYQTEDFNGWGYLGRNNSPYVWAGSQHYTAGKYIADHVYSATHVDQQLGCLPVLKALCNMSEEVRKRVGAPAPITKTDTAVITSEAAGTVATGVDAGWGPTEWTIAFLFFIALAVLTIVVLRKLRKKEPTNLPPVIEDPTLPLPDRGGAATEEGQ